MFTKLPIFHYFFSSRGPKNNYTQRRSSEEKMSKSFCAIVLSMFVSISLNGCADSEQEGDTSELLGVASGAIVHRGTKRCLDVKGNANHNGAEVILFKCNGQLNQQWDQIPMGGPHVGMYRSKSSGKCLDVKRNGQLQINICDGRRNELWTIQESAGNKRRFVLSNNTCLDVNKQGVLQTAKCHWGPYMMWDGF